jgi:hypothetical protein
MSWSSRFIVSAGRRVDACLNRPFRAAGSILLYVETQGVALGYPLSPLWGCCYVEFTEARYSHCTSHPHSESEDYNPEIDDYSSEHVTISP